jgi:hypothetical protein
MPTPAQIKAKIKELRSEIDQLKELMVISEQAQKK